MLSWGEIIIIILVGLLVVKPTDIPVIIKKIKYLKNHFINIKTTALSYVSEELDITSFESSPKELEQEQLNPEQLNFYLQKIIDIQGHYNGDYTLIALKTTYNELVIDQLNKAKKDLSSEQPDQGL